MVLGRNYSLYLIYINFLKFFASFKMTHGYLMKICGIRTKTPIFAIQL